MFKFAFGILSLGLLMQINPTFASSLEYHRSTLTNQNASTQSSTYQKRSSVARKTTEALSFRERLAAKIEERKQARLAVTTVPEVPLNETFSATANDFKITVPSGFTITRDTLRETTGSFVLENNEGDRIEVLATTDRCEGGNAAYFDCFGKYWKAEQTKFMRRLANAKTLQNIDLRWRNEVLTREQRAPDNTGRFLLIEHNNDRMAQFLFQVPRTEALWHVEFSGKDTGTLLGNANEVKRLLLTMFTENNTVNYNKDRLSLNEALDYQKRTAFATPRISRTLFSKKDVVAISANDTLFSVEVPTTFVKGSTDTLTDSMGMLEIVDSKSEATISITATAEICNSQTPNIVKNCILTQHRASKDVLSTSLENVNFLLEKSYDLQLLPGEFSKEDYGVLTLFRSTTESTRYGIFTWREPQAGYVWKASFVAPEDNDSILSNQQKLNALVTSILHSAAR